MTSRWWIYQRERFPLLSYSILVAAFSQCAVWCSVLLRGSPDGPGLPASLVAFAILLIAFAHLRIADEFKDAQDDRRFRPYRAVPRGLVTLYELKRVGLAAALVQLFLVAALDLALVALLAVVWLLMLLMSAEFLVPAWLRAHPIAYLASHMLILPVLTVLVAACDWLPAHAPLPLGLWPLLATNFALGIVFELGRKIRAPADEEPGVATYSALWGRRGAVCAWWIALAIAGVAAGLMSVPVHALSAVIATTVIAALVCGLSAWRFTCHPERIARGSLEYCSGIATIALYAALCSAPLTAALTGSGR